MNARDDYPDLADYCSFPMRSRTIRDAERALDEIDLLRERLGIVESAFLASCQCGGPRPDGTHDVYCALFDEATAEAP